MSLDTLLRPLSVTVNGLVGQATVADTLVWNGSTIRIHQMEGKRTITAVPGASFVGVNFHTGLWLAVCRYDMARGGQQIVPVFPELNLVIEPSGEPAPSSILEGLARPESQGLRAFRLQLGTLAAEVWVDARGRVVILRYPSLNLEAVREGTDAAKAVANVHAITSRTSQLAARPDTTVPPGTRAEAVEIQTKNARLAGTLLRPLGRHRVPAVILISGSGSQDRDGRLMLPGLEAYRPFRDIAHALAAKGIAVLRLDDRGVGGSFADSQIQDRTTWTVVHDVRAAIAALRSRSDIDSSRIGLLGHSEGALVAMMVAAEDHGLGGIALLAAPAVRGDTLLRMQLDEQLEATGKSAEARDSARTQQVVRLDSLFRDDALQEPMTAWLRTFIRLQPALFAARVTSPVFLLHGSRDRQVPSSQARTLERIFLRHPKANVTVKVVDGLNHLLLPAPTGAVTEYARLPIQALSADVLTMIGEWFDLQFAGPTGGDTNSRPRSSVELHGRTETGRLRVAHPPLGA